MSFAVTARLDNAFSYRVEKMRRTIEVSHSEIEPHPTYPPHITLSVFETDISLHYLTEHFVDLCRDISAFSVAISHCGIFPGKPSFVFLAPVVTKSLLSMHEQVVVALPARFVQQHYAIGCWVPHITVASVRESRTCALDDVLSDLHNCRTKVVGLELVYFPPVEVLAHVPLRHTAEGFPRP